MKWGGDIRTVVIAKSQNGELSIQKKPTEHWILLRQWGPWTLTWCARLPLSQQSDGRQGHSDESDGEILVGFGLLHHFWEPVGSMANLRSHNRVLHCKNNSDYSQLLPVQGCDFCRINRSLPKSLTGSLEVLGNLREHSPPPQGGFKRLWVCSGKAKKREEINLEMTLGLTNQGLKIKKFPLFSPRCPMAKSQRCSLSLNDLQGSENTTSL